MTLQLVDLVTREGGDRDGEELAAGLAEMVRAERWCLAPVDGLPAAGIAARALGTGAPAQAQEPLKSLPCPGGAAWVLAVPTELGGRRRAVVLARRSPRFSRAETARVSGVLRVLESARPERPRAVDIRDLRPSDAPAIVRMHERCSHLTRYRRYFSGMGDLPPHILDRLVDVDGARRLGLVAVLGPEVVGMAHCHRDSDASGTAEIAVVVEDAHQRRGIGSALLQALATAALDTGVAELYALALPDNPAIVRLIRACRFHTRMTLGDGVTRLTFVTG